MTSPRFLTLAVSALCLLSAGCGPILQHRTPAAELEHDEAVYEQAGYRVQRGDQIEIRHLVDPDYNAIVTVNPDGRITAPGLFTEVKAAGLTVKQLAKRLGRVYMAQAHIKNPTFSLILRSFSSQQVFVGGEVQKPGYLEITGDRDLLQVLVAAGGLLPTARTDEVIVVRRSVENKPMIFSCDVRKIMSGEDLDQDVHIRPMDVVLVPRSDVVYLDTWIDQHIRQVLPVPGSASASYSYNAGNAVVH